MHGSQNTQINWENSFNKTNYWFAHLLCGCYKPLLYYRKVHFVLTKFISLCLSLNMYRWLPFHKLITVFLCWLKTWVESPARLTEWQPENKSIQPASDWQLLLVTARGILLLKTLCFYGINLWQGCLVDLLWFCIFLKLSHFTSSDVLNHYASVSNCFKMGKSLSWLVCSAKVVQICQIANPKVVLSQHRLICVWCASMCAD